MYLFVEIFFENLTFGEDRSILEVMQVSCGICA